MERRQVVELRGHRVTTEAWTWADLAGLDAISCTDLVIAGDAFVARVPALLPDLRALAASRSVRRGARKLRRAAELLRVGAGSPMETRTRLLFAEAGLPEAALNAVINGEDGQFIARGDFVWRAAKVWSSTRVTTTAPTVGSGSTTSHAHACSSRWDGG